MKKNRSNPSHIVLTSHPPKDGKIPKITWGAKTLAERGPLIASMADHAASNVIGAYAGAYSVYRAVAVATGELDPLHVPDLHNTAPPVKIGPHEQWFEPGRIVSLDPWGHMVGEAFEEYRQKGLDVRPTIAVTRAHINVPEIHDAMRAGRLKPDGKILKENGDVRVTKAAIDPVWHLPGMAERLGVDEHDLRRSLFENSGGMFPELVTRPDLKVFLPPIGGHTLYFMGDVETIHDPNVPLACRVHDECNGSDVFGSDICTCRPYLCHGIELCIETAQQGGCGLVVYNRKEGRALGEVTKFLVYNARKRQEGGDSAAKYFERTECVAGVQDMRFQALMPDIFHWLGIKKIDRFASMSNMKHDALANHGIEIVHRIPIPAELIPPDAAVEMEAKKAAGYFVPDPDQVMDEKELQGVKGRGLDE
ncbi:GTP cyclohydrolase II [Micavibrio aeruginosavorus]|uniref:GTP cyclohydrolase II-like protein n=1 Tax=Micavibrio aeruginosavorus EPB TaxID=349215 RepID=M4VGF9_9BACT|nr:GTP cyclohydrolase II [Micavibrio aeruginosavorus]AGH97131.1 GTP cyclohydrolase II-like protein [Micavibrio aeruginosavorus EPB]